MHARVSTYEFPTDAIDEAPENFERALDQLEGVKGGILLVNRATGKGVSITYWESGETMASSRQTADRVRNEATQATSGSITSVEEYEVLINR
jgi:hypothetical protein